MLTNLGNVFLIVAACSLLTVVASGRNYNSLTAYSSFYRFLNPGNRFILDDSDNSPSQRKKTISQSENVECGQPEIPPLINNLRATIVGGIPAKPGSWPFAVSLRRYPPEWAPYSYHGCGGSVLNKQWIISAAHCFLDKNAENWKANLGRYTKDDDDPTLQVRDIEEIIFHPNYAADTYNNDIALLKLKDPISYTKFIRPICLPTSEPETSVNCTVVGWGDTRVKSDVLHQVTVPIISPWVCKKEYYRGAITDSMICAGYAEGGKDACQGDSGGPLMHQRRVDGAWELTGIVSWGDGCAKRGKPGVYTNVYRFDKWIQNTISRISDQ